MVSFIVAMGNLKKKKKKVFNCLPKCEEECHDGYQNQNSTMCNKDVEFMET
jgi:hypothetical protein